MSSESGEQENYDVIIDSNVFIALYIDSEKDHQDAVDLFEQLRLRQMRVLISNLIVIEVITVLSHKLGMTAARHFSLISKQIESIFVDRELFAESLALFEQQDERGTSFVDCSIVATQRLLHIPHVLTFDKALRKQFSLSDFGK